jgi:hypothetical protein
MNPLQILMLMAQYGPSLAKLVLAIIAAVEGETGRAQTTPSARVEATLAQLTSMVEMSRQVATELDDERHEASA